MFTYFVTAGDCCVFVGSGLVIFVLSHQFWKLRPCVWNIRNIDRTKNDKYLNRDKFTQGPFTEIRFLELKGELGISDFIKEF